MTGMVVGRFTRSNADNGRTMKRRLAAAIVSCGLFGCVVSTASMAGPRDGSAAAPGSGPALADAALQSTDDATRTGDRSDPSAGMPRLAARGDALAQAQPQPPKKGLGGVLSEIRVGGFVHDTGPASSNKEDGFDVNLELLFVSPRFMAAVFSPRPHIGVTVNTVGDTSLAYLGLSWEWTFWDHWFAGISGGGSIHNGELSTSRSDKKELGCRLLFRTTVEAGYRFAGRHSVSGVWSHNSNANICDHNEGLENVGIRYGYMF